MQPVPAAEFVAHARAITYSHGALVVEFTNGASPVTYAAQEASFQIPQEIVYEQLALLYEANGSQLAEYAQSPAPLTCAAPAVTHATRLTPMIQRVQKTVDVPQIQYVDKIVDAPVVALHQPVPVRVEDVSVGTQILQEEKAFHGDRLEHVTTFVGSSASA